MDKCLYLFAGLMCLVVIQAQRGDIADAGVGVTVDSRSTTTPGGTCGMKTADIVFVLDASNSIWPPHFRKQIDFVIEFIRSFDISFNQTRVAVTTFGDYPRLIYHLYHYGTADQMAEALSGVRQTGATSTNTGAAIRYMRQECFSQVNGDRQEAVNIGIVITDGASQAWAETIRQARLARNAGIYMFAIGVGDNRKINVTELTNIASSPKENYVFRVDNYDVLESIRHLLTERTCKVTKVPTPPPRQTTTQQITTSTKRTTTPTPTPTPTTVKPTTPTSSKPTAQPTPSQKLITTGITTEKASKKAATTSEERTTPLSTTVTTKKLVIPTKSLFPTQSPDKATKPPLGTPKIPGTEDRKGPSNATTTEQPQNIDFARPRSTSTVYLEPACGNKAKIDIMYIMPSADSINKTNMALRFFANLSSHFAVADDQVRIGLVPSGCGEVAGIQLNSYYTTGAMNQKFQALELKSDDIAAKLRQARTHSFTDCEGHRPGVRKAMIVIVDKEADNLCDVVLEAVAARREGIQIFVIAIGDGKVALEAQDIASHPIQQRIFHISTYQELLKITIKVWIQVERYCQKELP